MTEWGEEIAVNRVVVALDHAALAEAALDLAIRLASTLRAELSGLFVEDIDLLRLAGLPIAKETGFAVPVPRRVEPADVERTLKLQAQEMKGLLEEAAARGRVQWSFRVARGRVWASALAQTRERNLVLLARRSLAVATERARGGERTGEGPRAVLALFDGDGAAYRALGMAARLAYTTPCGLGVLIPAENPQALRRLRETAARWLEARGWKAEFYLHIPGVLAPALARAARAHRGEALVVPGDVLPGEEVLRDLLRTIPCPVLIAP